jgi:hypothetical protein
VQKQEEIIFPVYNRTPPGSFKPYDSSLAHQEIRIDSRPHSGQELDPNAPAPNQYIIDPNAPAPREFILDSNHSGVLAEYTEPVPMKEVEQVVEPPKNAPEAKIVDPPTDDAKPAQSCCETCWGKFCY